MTLVRSPAIAVGHVVRNPVHAIVQYLDQHDGKQRVAGSNPAGRARSPIHQGRQIPRLDSPARRSHPSHWIRTTSTSSSGGYTRKVTRPSP